MDRPVPNTEAFKACIQHGATGALKAIFFGLLFFDSGHPALRPSGRLRRSHALLRVRGPAKEKWLERRQTIETPAA